MFRNMTFSAVVIYLVLLWQTCYYHKHVIDSVRKVEIHTLLLYTNAGIMTLYIVLMVI